MLSSSDSLSSDLFYNKNKWQTIKPLQQLNSFNVVTKSIKKNLTQKYQIYLSLTIVIPPILPSTKTEHMKSTITYINQ